MNEKPLKESRTSNAVMAIISDKAHLSIKET